MVLPNFRLLGFGLKIQDLTTELCCRCCIEHFGLVLGQTPLACLFTLANLQPVLLNLWLVLLVHVILLPLRPPADQLGLPDLGVPDCGLEQRMLINTKLQMTQLILS